MKRTRKQPSPDYYTPPAIAAYIQSARGEGRNANPRQEAGNPADKPANVRKGSQTQPQTQAIIRKP